MNRIFFFLLFVILLSSSSCKEDVTNNYVTKFGPDFNSERKKLNIPLLDTSFRLVAKHKLEDSICYLSFSKSDDKDSLIMSNKIMTIVKGALNRDESCFLGKRKYVTIDGTFLETLFISLYKDSISNKYLWDCELHDREPPYIKITRDQADSILKSWNIYPY
ncbi:MAG: hypothetical protein V4685_02205 [Bacteroidota bacterium]